MKLSRKDYNEMAEIIREASWLIDVAPHTAKEVGIDPYDLVMNLGYFFEASGTIQKNTADCIRENLWFII